MSEIERPALLVLVRHAESARNKAKQGTVYFADEEARRTVRGVPDHKIALTEEGMVQAEKTGVYLRTRFGIPNYLYHSGYERTIQTADQILKAYPAEESKKVRVRMNPFIRERDPGYTYDMTETEVAAAFPHLEEYWQTFGGFFARPPGGESLAEVAERVYTFLNMLFRDRAGKKVWVVLHSGTLRAMRFLLERWPYEQATHWPPGQSPENCGITVYQYDPEQERLVLREYNTVAWR
jgi:broad specificity phosphatase PhoE